MIRRGAAPKYSDEGLTVINQKCIRNSSLLELEFSRRTDTEAKKVKEELYLQEGDVLINSTGTGTLGRSALFTGHKVPMTCDTHVTIARPDQTLVLGDFLAEIALNSEQTFIDRATGSTNQIELSAKSIKSVPISLPPLVEQRRIVDFMASIDSAIRSGERELNALKSFRTNALITLTSGEHEIPESYDEFMEDAS